MWLADGSLPLCCACLLIRPRNTNQVLIHLVKIRFLFSACKIGLIFWKVVPEFLNINRHFSVTFNAPLEFLVPLERNGASSQVRIHALDQNLCKFCCKILTTFDVIDIPFNRMLCHRCGPICDVEVGDIVIVLNDERWSRYPFFK